MIKMSAQAIIVTGFVLVLLGFAVPLLMTLGVIPPGFILGFISYGASVAGVMLGIIGGAMYVRVHRMR